jgi:hypothetical protein
LKQKRLFFLNLFGCGYAALGEDIPNLGGAVFREDQLCLAELSLADLREANLSHTDLSAVGLQGANLSGAELVLSNLRGADFRGADCFAMVFAEVDLSKVKGFDCITHHGPSPVGIDTPFRSEGKIPESFLRSCSVPEALITRLPSLIGSMDPIQFYSCSINYSSELSSTRRSDSIDDMARISYLKGDATQPRGGGNRVIAHVRNDLGGWRKGFAMAITKRWRASESAYRD